MNTALGSPIKDLTARLRAITNSPKAEVDLMQAELAAINATLLNDFFESLLDIAQRCEDNSNLKHLSFVDLVHNYQDAVADAFNAALKPQIGVGQALDAVRKVNESLQMGERRLRGGLASTHSMLKLGQLPS